MEVRLIAKFEEEESGLAAPALARCDELKVTYTDVRWMAGAGSKSTVRSTRAASSA